MARLRCRGQPEYSFGISCKSHTEYMTRPGPIYPPEISACHSSGTNGCLYVPDFLNRQTRDYCGWHWDGSLPARLESGDSKRNCNSGISGISGICNRLYRMTGMAATPVAQPSAHTCGNRERLLSPWAGHLLCHA